MTESAHLRATQTYSCPKAIADLCLPLIVELIHWQHGIAMLDGRPMIENGEAMQQRAIAVHGNVAGAELDHARVMGEAIVREWITTKRHIRQRMLRCSG